MPTRLPQVHAFDDETYILSHGRCINFEEPFLHLLFGTEKASLLSRNLEGSSSQGEAPSGSICVLLHPRLLQP
jgi:hypothetical protein